MPAYTQDLARRRFLQLSGATLAWLSTSRYGLTREEVRGLITRQETPYNAEPPLEKLADQWTTPSELMFVRSHGNVPEIDPDSYRLKIEGLVEKPQELTLGEIAKTGKAVKSHAVLTCAGNRRDELSAIKKISGVQWGAGAIGNPEWEGVSLRDVLATARIKPEAKHVWFEGLDEVDHDGHKIAFGGSIPLDKLATNAMPVLLATKMNGKPLTRQHGYPLRGVVPGFIGARSVKWLGKIVVSDRPSPNHFLAETYKVVQTNDPQEMAEADPIYETVRNSAICFPTAGAALKAGKVQLKGYAMPPGKQTATVAKVEVSVDGGKWQAAKLEKADQPYCWALWQHVVELSPGKHTLRVRSIDNRNEVQPEKPLWNAKGYLCNSWHTIEVEAA